MHSSYVISWYEGLINAMLKVNELYTQKETLLKYRIKTFQVFKEHFISDLSNPIIFVSDNIMLEKAEYFNFIHTNEMDYDIYTASFESAVLFYIIDIKIPLFKIVNNGVILRRGQAGKLPAKTPIKIKYALQHFHVVSNVGESVTIFATNITNDPTT